MVARARQTGRNWQRGVAAGFIGGVLAYVLEFVVIYLRKADSLDGDVVGAVRDLGDVSTQVDPPSAWQVVGWLQYAAHNVDIVVEASGLGRSGAGALPLTEGVLWERWFVLLPVVMLVGAGFLVAYVFSASDWSAGVLAGGSIVLGYGSLAVGGVFLTAWEFSVSYSVLSASGSVGPDVLTGVLLAGVAYPVVLGGLGGAVAGVVADGRDRPG